MSLSGQVEALPVRFARRLLAYALRYWPEETRSWGLALAAELDETTGTLETLSWSMGGVMLFARSVVQSAFSWLKLPAGASLSSVAGSGRNPEFLPKRSRSFTLGVFVATIVLLLLPQSREAIRTVRGSWIEYQTSSSDRRALDKLAAGAEKEKDAGMLAFVALRVNDPRRFEMLADRAVALNPKFLWIYAAHRRGPDGVRRWSQQLERLQATDPGNAVPKLLVAAAMEKPGGQAVYEHRSPQDKEIDRMLAIYPQWMALMEQAFTAPRYDSYVQRHFELTTSVWKHEPSLSPSVVLVGLWAHDIPSLWDITTFSNVRVHQAGVAFAHGNLKQAEQLLQGVDSFGDRMFTGSSTDIERFIGLGISKDASTEMSKLYRASGLTPEAEQADSRVKRIDERVENLKHTHLRVPTFRNAGIALQGFAGLAAIAGLAALTAILLLELLPTGFGNRRRLWRRVLSRVVDYGPTALLVATSAFLFSFLPYARALAQFRNAPDFFSGEREIGGALFQLAAIPEFTSSANGRLLMWYSITAALSGLGILVIGRIVYKAARVWVKQA